MVISFDTCALVDLFGGFTAIYMLCRDFDNPLLKSNHLHQCFTHWNHLIVSIWIRVAICLVMTFIESTSHDFHVWWWVWPEEKSGFYERHVTWKTTSSWMGFGMGQDSLVLGWWMVISPELHTHTNIQICLYIPYLRLQAGYPPMAQLFDCQALPAENTLSEEGMMLQTFLSPPGSVEIGEGWDWTDLTWNYGQCWTLMLTPAWFSWDRGTTLRAVELIFRGGPFN